MTDYDTIQDVNDALETVVVAEHDKGVVELRLDRPRRMNALDEQMLRELPVAVSHLDANPPEALVLTSSGTRAFCIGLDPEIFEGLEDSETPQEYFRRAVASNVDAIMGTLDRLPAPVVGAIQGAAYGGGVEVAIASDIRIAGESTEFSMPEVNHGFLPAGGATQRLPDLIGESRAKEIIFTDEIFDAETLTDWGLFSRTVGDDAVEAEAFDLAESLASRPRNSYAGVKQAIHDHNDRRQSGLGIEHDVTAEQIPEIDFSEIK